MTWEEQRLKLQSLAEKYAEQFDGFAALGPVHVSYDFEPDEDGCRFLFCNGQFSHGCYVDFDEETGGPADESGYGGNGPLVLTEMVYKPQYRHPPCVQCGGPA